MLSVLSLQRRSFPGHAFRQSSGVLNADGASTQKLHVASAGHLSLPVAVHKRTPSCQCCRMACTSALLDRMLSHQHAGTSSSFFRDVRPRLYSAPQRRARVVVASLTQSPSRTAAADLPQVARKEQNSGPARIFLTSTRAAAGQLWGVMKFFQAEQAAEVSSETDSSVLGDAAKRAKQVRPLSQRPCWLCYADQVLICPFACRLKRCKTKLRAKRRRSLLQTSQSISEPQA